MNDAEHMKESNVGTDLAVRSNGSDLDVMQLGRVLAQSGYFRDAREAAQATVKVLAGREMGVGPVASMTGIHIIEGKPVISAGLMAAAVKGSAKYDYKVKSKTDTECSLEFFEHGQSVGIETFTMKDAQAAGLAGKAVWKNYPKNMLFARCLSNGVRFYCAEVDAVGELVRPAVSETPEVAGKGERNMGKVRTADGEWVPVVRNPQHEAPAPADVPMPADEVRRRYEALLPRLDAIGAVYDPLPDGAKLSQARTWVQEHEVLVSAVEDSRIPVAF